jgi:hypothetical protein
MKNLQSLTSNSLFKLLLLCLQSKHFNPFSLQQQCQQWQTPHQ